MTHSLDDTDRDLLRLLAGREARTGEQLGRALGLSRAAVWKRIEGLRAMGVELEASRQQGYRLGAALEWLDEQAILAALAEQTRETLASLSVAFTLDSSNAELLRAGLPHAHALLAEHQSAGRGRRGRSWHSPLASNIYLSLSWHFPQGVAWLSRLGLALGVMVLEALERVGVGRAQLKWPNDLWLEGAKVGGCLVEIRGDSDGPCRVVAGVGLNLGLPDSLELDQAWANLSTDEGARPVPRHALAVALLDALVEGMQRYQQQGFDPFEQAWAAADALRNCPVRVLPALAEEAPWQGVAHGLGPAGGLLVERDGQQTELLAGEVSVRANDG